MPLRFITSGESHGKALIGVIEGIPAGLPLSAESINRDLKRRQGGYGRGGRMKIEADTAEILSGVRWGKTIGSPIALMIQNKDWPNWQEAMSALEAHKGSIQPVTRPRPGHADMAGTLKYDTRDIRDILERSSARETATRVALGAIAKQFISALGISIGSYVAGIGPISINCPSGASEKELISYAKRAESSNVRCPDADASKRMTRLIDEAREAGTSLGGIFVVFSLGAPAGLGSHIQWDRRLDASLAQAMMSIQAIKGVEIGTGFASARSRGDAVLDEIYLRGRAVVRKTNHAGGIEGGMTNGMPIVVRAAMKPIPTQGRPLKSVDIATRKAVKAAYERSDVCAVPAASVIGEAMTGLVMAKAALEKFGGDSIGETKRNLAAYLKHAAGFYK